MNLPATNNLMKASRIFAATMPPCCAHCPVWVLEYPPPPPSPPNYPSLLPSPQSLRSEVSRHHTPRAGMMKRQAKLDMRRSETLRVDCGHVHPNCPVPLHCLCFFSETNITETLQITAALGRNSLLLDGAILVSIGPRGGIWPSSLTHGFLGFPDLVVCRSPSSGGLVSTGSILGAGKTDVQLLPVKLERRRMSPQHGTPCRSITC